MQTRTEAIANFLKAATHADLAELYHQGMECQVNVAQDGGERIQGDFKGRQWNGWTDGVQTWKSIRIPRNANTVPEYDLLQKMSFSLNHAEGIGMTGWDWINRQSLWVAYDFDAISGHSDKHGRKLNDEELTKITELASSIPWVTVRKSASGKGLHLYVFLHPAVSTQNHNEHAALARAILSKMSASTGFDFENKVDICGQNMWVYHRKMKGTDGLALIKRGITLHEVPQNWKDHVRVVKGHSRLNLPRFVEQIEGQTESERTFMELMGQVTRTPLDDEHKRLIKWLEEQGTQSWWDTDHHILITHTYFLKQAFVELSLRGIYDTLSEGTDAPNDHNCFLHPIRDGAWIVRRYSMGCQEHPTWDQDGRGYTRCYYNRKPDLGTAARSKDGLESPSGGFIFKEAENALDVARTIGAIIPEFCTALRGQRATLKKHPDGRLLVEIEGDPGAVAAKEMPGWLFDKGKWKRLFNVPAASMGEVDTPSFDTIIRHVVTTSGDSYSWMLKGEGDTWYRKDLTHIRTAMESMSVSKKEIPLILGTSIQKCWKRVCIPFQPEYLGDRKWNLGAPQLRFVPSQSEDLSYPSWKSILDHCGKGLDQALQDNAWAKNNGVIKGSEYLMIWLSSLIKEPMEPLPYLFFYGEGNAGKSTFHEAVCLLLTKGYQRADVALMNQQGFNHELENAVLCVIEEINLRKNPQAGNRIKDWVTARQLPVHKKGETPYHVVNTTHWVQCSNESNACPIFTGDSRITMIHVEQLGPMEKIPKRQLMSKLETEASDFLGALMAIELPPSNDRLNVPIINTSDKLDLQMANRNAVEAFVQEKCFFNPGSMIPIADFYQAFTVFCDPDELHAWPKRRVTGELPIEYPTGRSTLNGVHCVGNISFTVPTEDEKKRPKLRLVVDDKKTRMLRPEVNRNGDH